MEAQDTARDDAERAQTVKSCMILRRYKHNPRISSDVEFRKGDYKRLKVMQESLTALSPWDGLSMRTCWRMSQECADAVYNHLTQDMCMLKFTCMVLKLFFLYLKNLG